MRRTSCTALLPLFLLTASCGGAAHSTEAPDAGDGLLAQTSFELPADGTPNDNGPIGPFCCTGTTVTVRNTSGDPLGYVYFFAWVGQAYNVNSTTSYAPELQILVSGAADVNDPTSTQVQGDIDFVASEMVPGLARSTTVGGLTYTVTLENVTTEQLSPGQTYFDMESLTARIDVTAN